MASLEEFFAKKKNPETPLMLDESYFPPGEIVMKPKDPSKGKPFAGLTKNAAGQSVAPAPIIQDIVPVRTPEEKVATPLDETKLQQIKREFSLNPQQIAPIEPQQSVNTPIDMGEIRQQASGMQPEYGAMDFLKHLTPLAIEGLFGGGETMGLSGNIAGTSMLKEQDDRRKRQYTLEDKLMEIQKARAIAGAKAKAGTSRMFQTKSVWNKEKGASEFVNYNTSTGEMTKMDGTPVDPKSVEVGFSVTPDEFNRRSDVRVEAGKELKDYTPRIDPETGLISRIEDGKIKSIGEQQRLMNPKQEKDLDNQIEKYITTDIYKKNAAIIQASSGIEGLLRASQSGNASAANVARSEIAKMAEGGGRLTDQDVERVGGPQDWRSKVNRFKNLQKNKRPLLDSDIAELREIASVMAKVARLKIQDSVKSMEEALRQKGGVEGTVGKAVAPYIPAEEHEEKPKNTDKVKYMKTPDGQVYEYRKNPKTGAWE